MPPMTESRVDFPTPFPPRMLYKTPRLIFRDTPRTISADFRSYRNQTSSKTTAGSSFFSGRRRPPGPAFGPVFGRGRTRRSSHCLAPLTVTGVSPVSNSAQILTQAGSAAAMSLFSFFMAPPISPGRVSAAIRPFSIKTTREQTGRTSSRWCSETTTVTPSSSLIFRSIWTKLEVATGSSCEVGSSSRRTSGCMTITEARLRICLCPSERSVTGRKNQLCIPKNEAISATRSRMVPLSHPRLSSPKASSCQTLSVTIWLSGLCET